MLPDDRDGCLQDVHWYSGGVGGAFQSYTIGNILSAQLYAAACKVHPQIPIEIQNGEFRTLHNWAEGQPVPTRAQMPCPTELIDRLVGGLNVQPYLAYPRTKFGEIYRL